MVFRFRQFGVHHQQSAHKVGTDGVLLGAWADVSQARRILDIGTGSGLIALMLAQRTESEVSIHAVEVDTDSASEATENVADSPWNKRIKVITEQIQLFTPEKRYDLIVCNPPYFVDSLHPPALRRTVARHATGLTYEELLTAAQRLLNSGGRFCTILPTTEGKQFERIASAAGWHCRRSLAFYTRKEKPQERILHEWRLYPGPLDEDSILMYDRKGNWSEEYRRLTGEFYLPR